jgi:hypothetical protein
MSGSKRILTGNEKEVTAFFARVSKLPPQICYCWCNPVEPFYSHCYIDFSDGAKYSKEPCPKCGSHTNIRKISSEKDTFIIRGGDVKSSKDIP